MCEENLVVTGSFDYIDTVPNPHIARFDQRRGRQRTPLQASGGTAAPANDCSGSHTIQP